MEIHERFVCGTTTLHNYLVELGYTVFKDKGKGSRREVVYRLYSDDDEKKLLNKEIINDHYHIILLSGIPGNIRKQKKEYRGYTISKELLKFFSQRQKEEIK